MMQMIGMTVGNDTPNSKPLRLGSDSVRDLVERVFDLSLPQTPGIAHALARLRTLLARLEQGRLQLAVVGQFKRGKSTLLNALLGEQVLPSAVTPLTAIPTFIRNGSVLKLCADYTDERREEIAPPGLDDLRERLARYVTEDGNPENRLGLARVEVEMPAPLLAAGVTLIDTPGVGSTFAHNTATAKALLPECDAALFVVSPDPPVTEVEIAYLKELRGVTPTIIVVLNKIDIVDGADKDRSERFLRREIASIGLGDAPLYQVSARNALSAKLNRNAAGRAESSLDALEAHLRDFIRERRDAVLRSAIARRAAGAIAEIAFEVDCRVAALRLPVDELSDKLVQFAADEQGFARERNASRDLLAGDRARMLAELDDQADRLRTRVGDDLRKELEQHIEQRAPEGAVVEGLRTRLPLIFQAKFERFEADVRSKLESLLTSHQHRGDELIGKVRRRASDLLAIPFVAPDANDAFRAKKSPFWVTDPRESLASISGGVLDTVLLPAARRRRLRDRLSRQIDEVVRRNVENLRWTIRQNLEDAIRSFQAELDDRLRLAQDATREAMELGLRRRYAQEDETKSAIDSLIRSADRLAAIAGALHGCC